MSSEETLTTEDRLRLLRFVCAFAWADLEIADKERDFVKQLAKELGSGEDELDKVEAWLTVPPRAEDVDPMDIDPAHRQLVLNSAVQMISADGKVDPDEVEILSLLEELLRGE